MTVAILIAMLLTGNPNDFVYATCGIVTEVNYETGWCVFTDAMGNPVPFFAEDNGFDEGDLVSAIMIGNETPYIADDTAIHVKYCGDKYWLPDVDYYELLTAGEE